MSDELRKDVPEANPGGAPEVVSEPAQKTSRKRKGGGPSFHKPGCQCPIHRKLNSRDGTQEAESDSTGSQETQIAKVLNADLPPLIARGRSERDRIAQWIELRALDPNITNKEAAIKMGLAPRTLNTLISKATREGWLKFDDPLSRLEFDLIPRTLDNLNHFLKKKDRTVTVEVAKGTIFKQFQESKGIMDTPTTVLALKIESPASQNGALENSNVKIVQGTIVGRPKGFSDISE